MKGFELNSKMNLFVLTFLLIALVPFAARGTKSQSHGASEGHSQCAKHCNSINAIGNNRCSAAGEVILRSSDCAFMKENGTVLEFVVGMNGQTEDRPIAERINGNGSANDGAHLCCKATQETATLFIVGVANKRLLLAKDVANFKFHHNASIDDFEREKQLLTQVLAQANSAGIGESYGAPFFQDQMDANKMIQKGYVRLWSAHHSSPPERVPDLVTETRPKVTEATEEMILALKVLQGFRPLDTCWPIVEKMAKTTRFLSLREPNGTDAMRKAVVRLCEKVSPPETVSKIDQKATRLLADSPPAK